MKIRYKMILLGLVLIGMVLVSGCTEKEIEKSNCIRSSGYWITFSDGCADSCEFERKISTVCAQALTAGCDCGPDKCWNGINCETN